MGDSFQMHFNDYEEQTKNDELFDKLNEENIDLKKDIKELVKYQKFAEEQLKRLSVKNEQLETKLASISNILEMTKYLSGSLETNDMISRINDMLIGILGVTKSSIFLVDDTDIATKDPILFDDEEEDVINRKTIYNQFSNGKPFLINSKESIFMDHKTNKEIHSVIGVPIEMKARIVGYLILEHTLYNYFKYDSIKFISSITNQIAVSLHSYMLYEQLRELAIRDPLLPIYTRKYFFETVNEKVRENPFKNFAIVMIDIDNFKCVNDNYGHQFGDCTLISTAKVIQESIGADDIIARYGGEEIVLYIDSVPTIDIIRDKIELIRERLENNEVCVDVLRHSVTASFGVSFYHDCSKDIDATLKRADQKLYEAKRNGKNQVRM